MRSCINPPPKYGGKDCVGQSQEFRPCGVKPCPGEHTILYELFDWFQLVGSDEVDRKRSSVTSKMKIRCSRKKRKFIV